MLFPTIGAGAILAARRRFNGAGSCNRPSKIYNRKFSGGVLAQLVERLNGIEEVRGSNPLGSTSSLRQGTHTAKPAPRGLDVRCDRDG